MLKLSFYIFYKKVFRYSNNTKAGNSF